MCIMFTHDSIHHVVQVDKSVQIAVAPFKKRSLVVCLLSSNFSVLNRHTSTDFKDIFTDHVTLCILSVLELIALSLKEGGGGKDW